jgi:hypothetical protein
MAFKFFSTGFDGNGPGNIRLEQVILIPAGGGIIRFDWRAGYDTTFGATLPRFFSFNVIVGGSQVISFLLFTAQPNSFEDSGPRTDSVDLTSLAGQTVTIQWQWFVAQEFTGPAHSWVDNVRFFSCGIIDPGFQPIILASADATSVSNFGNCVDYFPTGDLTVGLVRNSIQGSIVTTNDVFISFPLTGIKPDDLVSDAKIVLVSPRGNDNFKHAQVFSTDTTAAFNENIGCGGLPGVRRLESSPDTSSNSLVIDVSVLINELVFQGASAMTIKISYNPQTWVVTNTLVEDIVFLSRDASIGFPTLQLVSSKQIIIRD